MGWDVLKYCLRRMTGEDPYRETLVGLGRMGLKLGHPSRIT